MHGSIIISKQIWIKEKNYIISNFNVWLLNFVVVLTNELKGWIMYIYEYFGPKCLGSIDGMVYTWLYCNVLIFILSILKRKTCKFIKV